jgi:hypothetical protein
LMAAQGHGITVQRPGRQNAKRSGGPCSGPYRERT